MRNRRKKKKVFDLIQFNQGGLKMVAGPGEQAQSKELVGYDEVVGHHAGDELVFEGHKTPSARPFFRDERAERRRCRWPHTRLEGSRRRPRRPARRGLQAR